MNDQCQRGVALAPAFPSDWAREQLVPQTMLFPPPRTIQTGGTGSAKEKVVPAPGADSTQMRPPWRSTIFLHMASPMPVPGY